MNEDFRYLLDQDGELTKTEPVPGKILADYKSKLPDALLDFWAECGIGLLAKGRFQFCRPDVYQPIADVIFKGDKQFSPGRTHIYGFTAFGEIYAWNEEFQCVAVSLPLLTATADATAEDWQADDPGLAIMPSLLRIGVRNSGDWPEEATKNAFLFERARKALGELDLGECYGFVPALEMGGVSRLDNLKRVKALEHFAILAAVGPVTLYDYSKGGQTFVRELGPER